LTPFDQFFSPTYPIADFASPFKEFFPSTFFNEFEKGQQHMMKSDVVQTEKQIEFHVEMPGVEKDQVKVQVEDNVLQISCERNKKEEHQEGEYRVSERSYGSFRRSYRLPPNADRNIKAKLTDGVLYVTVPLATPENSKTVQIE
jgi:HSP20 family protein